MMGSGKHLLQVIRCHYVNHRSNLIEGCFTPFLEMLKSRRCRVIEAGARSTMELLNSLDHPLIWSGVSTKALLSSPVWSQSASTSGQGP